MKKLTPSQLYQTSIENCMRRANSELLPNTINMLYGLKGSQLMSEAVSFNLNCEACTGLADFEFGCDHKTSALDLSLLQRNLCLVLFLGIASFLEFTRPSPKLKRFDALHIELRFCQICIPVIIAGIKSLLNTLSYFHVFLPIDRSFMLRAVYSLYNNYFLNLVFNFACWMLGDPTQSLL